MTQALAPFDAGSRPEAIHHRPGKTLTAAVANWSSYLPNQVVLPHPSPRNQHWLTKNPWFEAETLPAVQTRIAAFMAP